MQDKIEYEFDRLPDEMLDTIAKFTTASVLENVSKTKMTYTASLFQHELTTRLLPFLRHVVEGEHEQVEALLKEDMSLLFTRGKVTDCSGRTFENISGFEYALWALDEPMWVRMLKCIPQNKEVFAKLLSQYNKVQTEGITYKLNGETFTKNHFDFENTIINALQMQVNSINAPETKNWDAIDKQWREGVGGAQKLLPMHVVNEYCSDEPFYPVPKFTSQPKSSKKFYNWITNKDEDWFNVGSKLGVEFAIYKGGPRDGRAALGGPHGCGVRGGSCANDLDAVKALCKVRTLDFINLKSQLEEQPCLDNHYQVVPM